MSKIELLARVDILERPLGRTGAPEMEEAPDIAHAYATMPATRGSFTARSRQANAEQENVAADIVCYEAFLVEITSGVFEYDLGFAWRSAVERLLRQVRRDPSPRLAALMRCPLPPAFGLFLLRASALCSRAAHLARRA